MRKRPRAQVPELGTRNRYRHQLNQEYNIERQSVNIRLLKCRNQEGVLNQRMFPFATVEWAERHGTGEAQLVRVALEKWKRGR